MLGDDWLHKTVTNVQLLAMCLILVDAVVDVGFKTRSAVTAVAGWMDKKSERDQTMASFTGNIKSDEENSSCHVNWSNNGIRK